MWWISETMQEGSCEDRKSFLQTINVIRKLRVKKTWRLSHKTDLSRTPLRKAILTSSWCKVQLRWIERDNIIRTVAALTTELKVWWKLIPGIWVKPCAIRRALWHSIDPSTWYLVRSTYFDPTILVPGGVEQDSKCDSTWGHQYLLAWWTITLETWRLI